MGAIYPTNPTQGCAFSHLSQKIIRLRHGQVPAEKAEIHSSIMYSSIRCDEHMDHLARRKQNSLPQQNPKRVEDFHHFFIIISLPFFLLIPNAPGFCFRFFLHLFFSEKKTAGCYDLYIKDRASSDCGRFGCLFLRARRASHDCEQRVLQDIKSNICFRSLCLPHYSPLVALIDRSLHMHACRLQFRLKFTMHYFPNLSLATQIDTRHPG
jgi:hypothetical protein